MELCGDRGGVLYIWLDVIAEGQSVGGGDTVYLVSVLWTYTFSFFLLIFSLFLSFVRVVLWLRLYFFLGAVGPSFFAFIWLAVDHRCLVAWLQTNYFLGFMIMSLCFWFLWQCSCAQSSLTSRGFGWSRVFVQHVV